MTDTQQPPNPARPAPLPQRQNGPQTVRIPVTNLVNPQPRRPISKDVPPEEIVEEPWQEDEFDPTDSGDDQEPSSQASPMGDQIQIPRRPVFARGSEQSEASERGEQGETRPGQAPPPASPLEGQPRPGLSTRPRLDSANRANTSSSPASGRPVLNPSRTDGARRPDVPAASGSGRPVLNSRTDSSSRPNTPAASGSGRPALVPRMELKPVLPVDPEKSGVNVIPVPPRVLAPPPPAPLTGGIPETPAPVRFTPQNIARGPIRFTPAGASDPADGPSQAAEIRPASAAPDLSTLLEHLVNLPDQTAILGVCEDRLPVLLDLGDPTPGALLVASDDESLRDRLVRTLLQTAAALNSPRSVQFLILSSRPADWQAWLDGLDAVRHCLGIDSLIEGSPARWLLKLAGWADQRRTGTSNGPAVILVVDDLASVPQLDYDARVNFDWLVKEGPGVRIWPVVGMAVQRAPELTRWVRLFKTRILGPAQDAALYQQLAALDEPESSDLFNSTQFAVRIQENWLKFRVPALPGEND